MAGFSDVEQRLCLGLALWNGSDPFLKERMFGLTGAQGNHGEDVKEYWWYLDALPSHAWNRWRDQVTPWGTFTRFTPPVAFSHTPSMALRPVAWPGADPDTIGWTADPAGDGPPELPHYPSKLAREGRIRNFVPNFGIEDRGDGGGVVGLASITNPAALEAQLKKYGAPSLSRA